MTNKIYTVNEIESLSKEEKVSIWKNITKEQLEYLFVEQDLLDSEIEKLFDIKKSQVTYKRKKYNIKFKDKILKDFITNVPSEINELCKKSILESFDVDKYAKVITHYAFRNGPVEDMHANNQLSQKDMKILNKYMVNRIAGILKLIKENQWFKIGALIDMNKFYGIEWDEAEPDTDDIDKYMKIMCK